MLWDSTTLTAEGIPRVELDQLLDQGDSERGLRELVTSLLTYGIGLVTGVPTTLEGTQKAAERLCFIQVKDMSVLLSRVIP